MLPVAVTARLIFGVFEGLAKSRLQRVGLARGGNGLLPGLHGQLRNLHVPLRAENNAGAALFLPRMRAMRSIPSSACVRRALEIFTCLAVNSTSMVSLRFFLFSEHIFPAGEIGFYSEWLPVVSSSVIRFQRSESFRAGNRAHECNRQFTIAGTICLRFEAES